MAMLEEVNLRLCTRRRGAYLMYAKGRNQTRTRKNEPATLMGQLPQLIASLFGGIATRNDTKFIRARGERL